MRAADPNKPLLRFRKLRIAFSAVCGVVCLLLIMFWIRSYWWLDSAGGSMFSNSVYFESAHGKVAMIWTPAQEGIDLGHVSFKHGRIGEALELWEDIAGLELGALGFGIFRSDDASDTSVNAIAVPYWFPLLITAISTGLLWNGWKWHFSLRTLLIATTLFALLLGLVVYATR